MKSYPNIEKSKFRPMEYVGYANGAWHIYKYHIGSYQGWRASHQTTGKIIEGHSLKVISRKLEDEQK